MAVDRLIHPSETYDELRRFSSVTGRWLHENPRHSINLRLMEDLRMVTVLPWPYASVPTYVLRWRSDLPEKW